DFVPRSAAFVGRWSGELPSAPQKGFLGEPNSRTRANVTPGALASQKLHASMVQSRQPLIEKEQV
ncbi:MAG TPA: hypothetical protein VFU22_01720, partial [Roseiflexaceae bacterium]|nr:hypothetical protein [Roseiflexaceae bacterium]